MQCTLTGVVTVANSALLDYATDPAWNIRVIAKGAFAFEKKSSHSVRVQVKTASGFRGQGLHDQRRERQ